MTGYDVIVVGAGSAGCALAARLSEDPTCRVLLIEAGGDAGHPLIRIPLAWPGAAAAPRFGWGYATEPEVGTAMRSLDMPRGRLLGGTSSINGMMYTRGAARDYDDWAQMGLVGWSYDDVLPYFRRSETNWRGESRFHGGEGPLNVARNARNPVVYDRMIATGRALGYREIDDFNGPVQRGFGMADFTVANGRRESGATAFLAPAADRANLHLWRNTQVHRLVIHGARVVGLDYVRDGVAGHVAGGEIVLSAGAYNSPHVLLLSGIGPADEVHGAGVRPRHDLPAVGRNLQDHPMVMTEFAAKVPLGFEELMRVDRFARAALRWATGRGGPLTDAPLSVQGFVNCSNTEDEADTQFQITHASMNARPWFPGWRRGIGERFTCTALQLRPEGRGSVTLRSPDPSEKPSIRLGLLANQRDRAAARDMLAFTRRFFATMPLADIVEEELVPGRHVTDPAAIDHFLATTMTTGMHPAGSCAMGADGATSVVDATLRVHGLAGLRVADTSIMPRIVGGNTSAPAMMIGEKCADLVLGRTLSPVVPELMP